MASAIRCAADGWRAHIDEDFTDENIARVADAVARLWAPMIPGITLYVGYDARPESEHAALLAAAVAASRGLTVRVSGAPCPLPALAWAVMQDLHACGGIMVTGGARPCGYAGVMLVNANGSPALESDYECLESALRAEVPDARAGFERVDLLDPYIDELCSFAPPSTGADRAPGGAEPGQAAADQAERVRVICDPLYGGAQGVLPRALERLGIEAHEIHRGPYRDCEDVRPDPVEPWVDDCEQAATDAQAWAGLALDGTGSRFGAVDENGAFVGPQKVFALIMGYLVEKCGMTGRVVGPGSLSTLVRRQAKRLGCPLTITSWSLRRLGDEVARGNVLIAGEDWGSVALPGHLPLFDGLMVQVLLCRLMAEKRKPLGALVDELEAQLGRMVFGQRELRLDAEVMETFRMMAPGLNRERVAGKEPVEVSHLDGLRFGFADGSWLLLRPDVEDPVMRIAAEAPDVEQRDALLDAGVEIARNAAGT